MTQSRETCVIADTGADAATVAGADTGNDNAAEDKLAVWPGFPVLDHGNGHRIGRRNKEILAPQCLAHRQVEA